MSVSSLPDMDLQAGSTLPIVDLDLFLANPGSPESIAECKKVGTVINLPLVRFGG